MVNNAQKTHFVRTQNLFAENKIREALAQIGKGLPATVKSVDGQIVTVSFNVQGSFTLPQVTVPVATSTYRREPIQVGDRGVVRSSDVPLGNISGLGSDTAPVFPTTTANLEALVWEPVASAKWDPSPDPDAYLIQGPNGFYLRDVGGNCTVVGDRENITVTGKTALTLQVGGSSIVIDSSGIHLNGVVDVQGHAYLSHQHGGVQSGPPTTFTSGVHNP